MPPPEVGSWLPIYAVLERLEELDWRLAPHVALPILRRLAEAGRLRRRGRRCDETGLPYGATIEIATAEWIGLEFHPALLLGPHPGTVHDRTARHRTVYAEVELSGADLSQLRRSGAFQQPGWASAATPPSTTHQPGPSVGPPSSSVANNDQAPANVGSSSAKPAPLKGDVDQRYRQHMRELGRRPKKPEDETWRCAEKIPRRRVRQLRKKYPLYPPPKTDS